MCLYDADRGVWPLDAHQILFSTILKIRSNMESWLRRLVLSSFPRFRSFQLTAGSD